MDIENVQNEESLEPQKPEDAPKGQETTPLQPSQEELLADKIRQAVEAEVAKATQTARREIQSAKDKARAEVEHAQRRATMAERVLGATRTNIQSLDPDVAKELELAELRAREQSRLAYEREDTTAQASEKFVNDFSTTINQFITDMGIDPTDKRIDWAEDAPNMLDVMRRVQTSVAKINKENLQTLQTAQSGLSKRLTELEKKSREENIENNSVEATTSGGVVGVSDADFKHRFGVGELPNTKENQERYRKILNS